MLVTECMRHLPSAMLAPQPSITLLVIALSLFHIVYTIARVIEGLVDRVEIVMAVGILRVRLVRGAEHLANDIGLVSVFQWYPKVRLLDKTGRGRA
jgi:hypothetical protein